MSKIKIDRNFSRNRSDQYQHAILESPYPPDILTEFSDSKGLANILNNDIYDEELFILRDDLRNARWRIIHQKLTTRQRQVIRLCADGYTQTEIATILEVNQSSITKSINGNCDYKSGKRVYGGAKKKLRKHASQDHEIQFILDRISEIYNEKGC